MLSGFFISIVLTCIILFYYNKGRKKPHEQGRLPPRRSISNRQ